MKKKAKKGEKSDDLEEELDEKNQILPEPQSQVKCKFHSHNIIFSL